MDESSYKQMQDGAYAPPKATTTATAVAYAEGQPVAYANPNYMPTAVAVPYDAGMGGVVTVVYVADAPIPQKMDFLRKVFFTLSAQLLVTFAIVLMFYIPGCNPVSPNMSINGSLLNCTGDSLHTIVSNSSWIIWVTLVAWLVLYVVCVCTQPVCRKAPVNYIILFTFTLGTGIFLGVLSCYSSLVEVVLAVALTLLISISLIVLTRFSFVNGFVGPAPFVAVAVMAIVWTSFLFIPVGIGIPWYTYYNVLWSGLGVLIFSLFIVWDTTQILNGTHRKFRFGFGDHCTAALSLYLDIVNLFICLLSGGRR